MRAILLYFVLMLSVSLFSCSKGKDKQEPLSFDSIKADTTVFLGTDTLSPRCHVSLSITYAKGENSDYINDSIIRSGVLSPDYFSLNDEKLPIQQIVDSFISRYVSEYKTDYGEIYKVDKTSQSLNSEYIVKTSVSPKTDNYITYTADVYMYGGGAHGNSLVIAKNIDTKTGKIVSLDDILSNGYEEKLSELILNKICKEYKAKNLEDLKQKGFFMGTDPYPSDNFIISKKGITFIYSPDEIAPHAVGEIRIFIDKDDIKSLLK